MAISRSAEQFVHLFHDRKSIGDVEDIGFALHSRSRHKWLMARRLFMNRQPTAWGSSPWQQVDSPFGWRGL